MTDPRDALTPTYVAPLLEQVGAFVDAPAATLERTRRGSRVDEGADLLEQGRHVRRRERVARMPSLSAQATGRRRSAGGAGSSSSRSVTVIATSPSPSSSSSRSTSVWPSGLTACGNDPAVTDTVTVPSATPSVTASTPSGARQTVALYFLRGDLGVAHRAVPESVTPGGRTRTGRQSPSRRSRAGHDDPRGHDAQDGRRSRRARRVDLSEEFASEAARCRCRPGSPRSCTRSPSSAASRRRRVPPRRRQRAASAAPTGRSCCRCSSSRRRHRRPKLRVSGSASVFEATFVAQIVSPTGQLVVDQTVTARRARPGAAFEVRLDLPAPARASRWRTAAG